ncbi:flagellar basal body-associated FliL family protein [Roseobacter sp. HKCCA0434]|uniref:flagellar basal body-associated FliL family protein n=1 Tax=Roseobacter sp. HKCCA0434 TaxID=3079297 RepID=UPI0029058E30|nr:flagellar basal body-associated FliL family protein [Roseobacter sp. HKCCA0434]
MRKILIVLVPALAIVAGGAAAWMQRDGTVQTPQPEAGGTELVELPNQFVVPLTRGDDIAGLIAVSLAVEVAEGHSEATLAQEPRLRDAFLQVLFDHARSGGFAGDFTGGTSMGELRAHLALTAREVGGPALKSVLITNLARQDF